MASSLSAITGKILGLGGQVTSNSSACTTGTEAVFEGYKNIILGYSDSMYVGGAEGTHHGIYSGFDAMKHVLCSTYNDLPEKGSQPMSAGACGFVPAGGAAVLRLESLESAQARGATILCELVSAYCNSGGQRDGGSMTFPNIEGVRRCIRHVLDDSGIKPEEISLINGHLTSTGADPSEVASWRNALKLEPENFPLIQSTKSMIGHGLGAAGAIESVAVVDQIVNGYVHPSINCEEVHPEIAPISKSIPRQLIKKDLEYVIKSSFGFGDVNGCLLFKRWHGK
jgi:3-oxoacyl-(acyl-carrier-protein) synthase